MRLTQDQYDALKNDRQRFAPNQIQNVPGVLLDCELPYAPSVNHYWHHVGQGKAHRVYISKKGNEFIQAVKLLAKSKMSLARLSGEFEICPPDRRKRDLDNLLKALLDALAKAGLYLDDEQFDRIVLTRGSVVKGGCIRAKVIEIN